MRTAINYYALKVQECSGSPPHEPTPVPSGTASDPESPLIWWRTRAPSQFTEKDTTILRWALLQNRIAEEPYWPDAVIGKVTAAINVAVGRLKTRPIDHPEVDLALSAMLACALEHDVTSGILISSALRRRASIDPPCRVLSDLWLIADF
ncbi:MAG: hypothetical protein J0H51_18175 [Rhizobiales bacterium]|nr:hypothetical protein [Hyphomicrobiales bacterium]